MPGFYNFPEKQIQEDEIIEFELWENNYKIWEVYNILRSYNSKDFEMNSPILLKLIEDYSREDQLLFLEQIPVLHFAYVGVINKWQIDKIRNSDG